MKLHDRTSVEGTTPPIYIGHRQFRFADVTLQPITMSILGGYRRRGITMLVVRPELGDHMVPVLGQLVAGRIRFHRLRRLHCLPREQWNELMASPKVSDLRIGSWRWTKLKQSDLRGIGTGHPVLCVDGLRRRLPPKLPPNGSHEQ
jgi:hypothetical protein